MSRPEEKRGIELCEREPNRIAGGEPFSVAPGGQDYYELHDLKPDPPVRGKRLGYVVVAIGVASGMFVWAVMRLHANPPTDKTVAAVKFTAAIVTGIGAITAAAARIAEGKRATWLSRGAFSIAIVALLVTAVSQTAEYRRTAISAANSAATAKKQIDTLGTILTEVKVQQAAAAETLAAIQRVVTKFDSVTVTCWSKLPPDHPAVAAYNKRLQPHLRPGIENPETFRPFGAVTLSSFKRDSGGILERVTLDVGSDSTLFPADEDSVLAEALGLGVWVAFFRMPIDPTNFIALDLLSRAELSFPFLRATSSRLTYTHPAGEWHLVQGNMTVSRGDSFWRANGQITSVADLRGTQVFICSDLPLTHADDPKRTKSLMAYRDGLRFDYLSFHINGETYAINDHELKRSVSKNGVPVWSYVFPDTIEGLAELAR